MPYCAAILIGFLGLSHQATIPSPPQRLLPLKFRPDGTFHISVFADLHFGAFANSIRGPEQDAKTTKVMATVLDAEQPDFVVINGDLVNRDLDRADNSGIKYLDQIVSPMIERGLSWASTYGNHDHEPNSNANALWKREKSFSGCRTRKMVCNTNAGTTNYYLPVYPRGCTEPKNCVPELLLWFFDSRGGYYYQKRDTQGRGIHQPNWVDESVVNWFTSTRTALETRYQKVVPSLAFVHIPVNATVVMQTQRGIHPNYQPGINDQIPGTPQASQWCTNGTRNWDTQCTYGGQDVPFMRALVETKGLMGLFSGHDHGNSWCYRWDVAAPGTDIVGDGLNLCYGQRSGYGGFGDWIRGSRQILVSLDQLSKFAVDSHIRLETGDVVGAISLNTTYNKDFYPETPNEKTYWDMP